MAGIAGLLAGGFSMAVGEYVSVRSQRELLDYQVELQRHQLVHTPEEERSILCGIYETKGLSRAEADLIVGRILADPKRALETFVQEEIGLSKKTMGSPISAGLGSLVAFVIGALVPLVPYLLIPMVLAFPPAQSHRVRERKSSTCCPRRSPRSSRFLHAERTRSQVPQLAADLAAATRGHDPQELSVVRLAAISPVGAGPARRPRAIPTQTTIPATTIARATMPVTSSPMSPSIPPALKTFSASEVKPDQRLTSCHRARERLTDPSFAGPPATMRTGGSHSLSPA